MKSDAQKEFRLSGDAQAGQQVFVSRSAFRGVLIAVAIAMAMPVPAPGERLSLQALVTPSTVVRSKHGHPITFALHGFIEFKSLNEMISYIDSQNQRWKANGGINEDQRQAAVRDLLRR